MSNGNLGTDAGKDIGEKAVADYALTIELEAGESRTVEFVHVYNHSLRSGFMVIEYAGGEQWFRASDVVRVIKSYM